MSDVFIVRAFPCSKCGWLLGEVYREKAERITQLRVYRFARHPNSGIDARDVPTWHKFVVLQMNDGAVLCTCGHRENWYANQTSIGEMIARRNGRKKVT